MEIDPDATADPTEDGPAEASRRPLDASGRRDDKQAWLGVDRCAYAFHAARCADPACRAAGDRGHQPCRSKLDWLGFAPRGRGGRVHMRSRMYDAVLKCLGAVMRRVPPRTTPHARLALVVEAFLLHTAEGRRWERFGDFPLRAVDAALAQRLREPEPPRPPRGAPAETAAARALAEKAAAFAAPRRGIRDAALAKFGNGHAADRHAPERYVGEVVPTIHPIHSDAPAQEERYAQRYSGVHSVTRDRPDDRPDGVDEPPPSPPSAEPAPAPTVMGGGRR